MKQFSIKELERLTEVKAFTIRTWEKRYGILNPGRNIANIRHYSLADVHQLLDVSLLVKLGLRISQISKMETVAIEKRISSLNSDDVKILIQVNKLIICLYTANIEEFELILNNSISSWGIDKTIKDIILSFLEKTQIISYKDSSIETHFVVTVIRKKLILGIEEIRNASSPSKSMLLFLPKGEHYDLLLLYMAYEIKSTGFNVLYLGTNISNNNLEIVINNKKPDYLFTYISSIQNVNLDSYSTFLNSNFPTVKLFVAVPMKDINEKTFPTNIHSFYYKDLKKELGII